MPEPRVHLLFAGAALALLVTPGPAVAYIVARSVEQGFRAGFVSALGLVSGGAVHVLAAAVGVSALLSASPRALAVIGWAGALYLAWLGASELRAEGVPDGPSPVPARGRVRLYGQGLVVSLLNPKALLFFLAFLPQFVRPESGDPRSQILVLGGTFLLLALCTDTAWAAAAGRAGARLRAPDRVRARRRLTATIYFALAFAAVVHQA